MKIDFHMFKFIVFGLLFVFIVVGLISIASLSSKQNKESKTINTEASASTSRSGSFVYQVVLHGNDNQLVKIRQCQVPEIDTPNDTSYEDDITCEETEELSINKLDLPPNLDKLLSYSVIPLNDQRISQAVLAEDGETVYINNCKYSIDESGNLTIDRAGTCSSFAMFSLNKKIKSLQRFMYEQDGVKKIRTLTVLDSNSNATESVTCEYEETNFTDNSLIGQCGGIRNQFSFNSSLFSTELGISIDSNDLKDYSGLLVGDEKRIHLSYVTESNDMVFFLYCPWENGNPVCGDTSDSFSRATFAFRNEDMANIQSFSRFEYNIPEPLPTMAPGPVIAGDCNGDREVGVADLTAILLRIFDDLFLDQEGCDVNRDGGVDSGDVSCLSLILSGDACPGSGTVFPTNTPVTPTNTPLTPTNTPVTPTNTPLTPTNTPVPPTVTGIPLSDLDIIYARSGTNVDEGLLSISSATEVTIQSSFLTGTSSSPPLRVLFGTCTQDFSTYTCTSTDPQDFIFQLDATGVAGDLNNITVQATDRSETVGLIFDPEFEANEAISVNLIMNFSPFEVYPEARYAALKNNRLDVSNFEKLVVETDFSSGRINPENNQARDNCTIRFNPLSCENNEPSPNISDYVFTLSDDVSGELTIQGPSDISFLTGTFEL